MRIHRNWEESFGCWVGGEIHTHRPLTVGCGGYVVGGFLDKHCADCSRFHGIVSRATKLEAIIIDVVGETSLSIRTRGQSCALTKWDITPCAKYNIQNTIWFIVCFMDEIELIEH